MARSVVVVGAGPAGMSAALEAHARGARVTIIDEAARPGGQIYRQPHENLAVGDFAEASERGRKERLLSAFKRICDFVDYRPGTSAFALFKTGELQVSRGNGTELLRRGGRAHERGSRDYRPVSRLDDAGRHVCRRSSSAAQVAIRPRRSAHRDRRSGAPPDCGRSADSARRRDCGDARGVESIDGRRAPASRAVERTGARAGRSVVSLQRSFAPGCRCSRGMSLYASAGANRSMGWYSLASIRTASSCRTANAPSRVT